MHEKYTHECIRVTNKRIMSFILPRPRHCIFCLVLMSCEQPRNGKESSHPQILESDTAISLIFLLYQVSCSVESTTSWIKCHLSTRREAPLLEQVKGTQSKKPYPLIARRKCKTFILCLSSSNCNGNKHTQGSIGAHPFATNDFIQMPKCYTRSSK